MLQAGVVGHVASAVGHPAAAFDLAAAVEGDAPAPTLAGVVEAQVERQPVDVRLRGALHFDVEAAGAERRAAGQPQHLVAPLGHVAGVVARAGADAPALAQLVGDDRVHRPQLELLIAGAEAAGEEGRLPLEAIPRAVVDADAEGEWVAVLGQVPAGVDVGRNGDDVLHPERAGRAEVVVERRRVVEAQLVVRALEASDRRRVVVEPAGVAGTGDESARLRGGTAAVLEEERAAGVGGGGDEGRGGDEGEDASEGRDDHTQGAHPAESEL